MDNYDCNPLGPKLMHFPKNQQKTKYSNHSIIHYEGWESKQVKMKVNKIMHA